MCGSSLKNRGFSLFELLVSIVIFSVMSTMVIVNYRASSRALTLTSLANIIAADIRNAQAQGISSIVDAGGSTAGKGASFAVGNNYYKTFIDSNANGLNDSGAGCAGECVSRVQFKPGYSITDVCLNKKGGISVDCGPANIHITYRRPNPEAYYASSPALAVHPYSDASIEITEAASGAKRTIYVWKTGLIVID